MMRGLISVAVAVLAFTGCASQQQKIEAASQISAADDQFQPFREYASGAINSIELRQSDAFRLVARIDRKTNACTSLLSYRVTYRSGQRFTYESARNDRADELKIYVVDRHASYCKRSEHECDYTEIMNVVIPEADLRQTGPDGYRIKLFSRMGLAQLVTIPKPVIVAVMAKVDADQGAPAAVQSAPTKPVASVAH